MVSPASRSNCLLASGGAPLWWGHTGTAECSCLGLGDDRGGAAEPGLDAVGVRFNHRVITLLRLELEVPGATGAGAQHGDPGLLDEGLRLQLRRRLGLGGRLGGRLLGLRLRLLDRLRGLSVQLRGRSCRLSGLGLDGLGGRHRGRRRDLLSDRCLYLGRACQEGVVPAARADDLNPGHISLLGLRLRGLRLLATHCGQEAQSD
mmetsp:Transcript_45912/g.118787  ORF Transcript_45912/g.118787 Transcript_45912/m.118787 type:complete len:204 (+) Transcript_45912:260-871(+)